MLSRLIAFAVVIAVLVGGSGQLRVSAADDPVTTHIGQRIANVAFVDADGNTTQLHGLTNKKAIVVVFLSFECPVSKSYMQPLSEMAAELKPQGVAFIGLTANQDDSAAEVAKVAGEYNASFPIYLDKQYAAADALAAQHTPEVFVLDGGHVLRYRGRIDDSWQARLKRNQQITKNDLRQALAEMLADKSVSTPSTVAVGCSINRGAATTAKAGEVTYYGDVLPILQTNCQECHRPGEVAPFSLLTYRQAVNWASDIKEYTQKRVMPPWKITAGVPFQNDRRLSDQDIATLAAWADSGTPEGDAGSAPPPVKFSEGWRLGTPDLVLIMPDNYQLGPNGRDLFQCFVLPTELTDDKYVEAIDIRAGNTRVVHHAVLSIDTSGRGRTMEKGQQAKPLPAEHPLDKGPGFTSSMPVIGVGGGILDTWVPGQQPHVLPAGTGIRLPKGSDVIMQLHYHRSGRVESDKTSIALYFAKEKVERPFRNGFIFTQLSEIPAGDERYVVKGFSNVSGDLNLHQIMPHMHMVGKEFKVVMTTPEGEKSVVLHITDWDFNWQETYFFKEPLKLKAGSRLDLEAVYDNSARNPNNPFNPPRNVTFGEETFNEMCLAILGGIPDRGTGGLPMGGTMFGARMPR